MAKLFSSEKIPLELRSKINPVKQRILFLSPSVASGHEREPKKEDFEALSGNTIGTGGFGKVYKVRHKVSQNVYAIKVINKSKIIESDLCGQIRLEVRIMYSLNHEHIVKLYNHFEDDEHFYLVLEYMPKGHLYEKLKLMGRLNEKLAAQYMREVFSAVEYLHSMTPPIIHRDIKPENILLDSKERAKLCDFGWSNFFNANSKRMTYCGTPDYLSPEMIKKEGHDQTIDLWNLGVLLFELLTGRPPFQGADQKELFANILRLKIVYPKDFPKLAHDLVNKLLKVVPKERISLKAAIAHPWFKSVPEMRPVLTRAVKMEKQLPTLDHDLEEGDFEPVSRVSKVNREDVEEEKRPATAARRVKPEHIKIVSEVPKDDPLTDLSNRLQKTAKELNETKLALHSKSRELDSVKKDYEDMKGLLGSSDRGYVSFDKHEIRRLTEEVQKLKGTNKAREEENVELEKKVAELTETAGQAKILANEIETLRGAKLLLEGKLADTQHKLEELHKACFGMKGMLKDEELSKEKNKAELEQKIDELNYKLMTRTSVEGGGAENIEEEDDMSAGEAADACRKLLAEIRDKAGKTLDFKKHETTLKQELLAAHKNLTGTKVQYEQQLQDIQEAKDKEIVAARAEVIKEMRMKLAAKDKEIEELSFQVSQYEAEEGRAAMEGHNLKTLQSQNAQLLKINNDFKLQVMLYGKEQKALQTKLKANWNRTQDLEMQVSQLKGSRTASPKS